jgi:hypothetical protein
MDHLFQADTPVPDRDATKFRLEPAEVLTAYRQFAFTVDRVSKEVKFVGTAYPALFPVDLKPHPDLDKLGYAPFHPFGGFLAFDQYDLIIGIAHKPVSPNF